MENNNVKNSEKEVKKQANKILKENSKFTTSESKSIFLDSTTGEEAPKNYASNNKKNDNNKDK